MLTVIELWKNYTTFMVSDSYMPCSQEPVNLKEAFLYKYQINIIIFCRNKTNSFIINLEIWQHVSAHLAIIRPIHKP